MSAAGRASTGSRLLPAAGLIAPFLPIVLAPIWLLGVSVLWLRSRPAARELRLVGALLALALVGLVPPLLSGGIGSDESVEVRLARGFEGLWGGLEETAASAASALDEPSSPQATFDTLRRIAEEAGRTTLLVLDADDVPVAWAGEGLLHEIESLQAVPAGRSFRAGFSTVTLLAARELGAVQPGRRLVAGRSFPTDRLPWDEPRLAVRRWSVVRADQETAAGLLRAPVEGETAFVVDGAPQAAPRLRDTWAGRWALGVLALAALAAGVLAVSAEGPERSLGAGLGLLVAGLAGVLAALDLDPLIAGLAVLAAAMACAVALAPRLRGVRPVAAGLVAALVPPAAGVWLHSARHPIDLGSRLVADVDSVALGVAIVLASLAGLGSAFGREEGGGRERRAWGALAALLVGGLFLDRPWLGYPLLLVGAVLAASWAARSTFPKRAAPVAVSVVLAALIAALGWELSYRTSLKRHLRIHTLDEVASPAPDELEERARDLQAHFRELDLASLALGDPDLLESRDLAYAVWNSSPLALRGALSAIAVTTGDERRSTFSFGLPVTEEGEMDRSPARWRQIGEAFRTTRVVEGEAELLLGERPWGVARYWLFLQPGARAGRIDNLAAGLLRGEPIELRPAHGVLGTVPFVLYSPEGQVLSTPWAETPPAAAVRALDRADRLRTPAGRSLVFKLEAPEGLRVLFLPMLAPWRSLERVATLAAAPAAILAVAMLLAFLARVRLTTLRRAVALAFRSYSQRLLIVSTAFVMLPLLAVGILLVGVLGQRLEREQRAAGRAALESAQRILGEYVLTLDPGFVMETAVGDEILTWLSRVVHHEVNLYWGSSVYATSKRALFTAGLLPERIPGEIYSRLSLDRAEVASRTNLAGGTRYLELYAPVPIPGIPVDSIPLYASIPLLAQEEEVGEELAALRRRAVLLTTALGLLLAALGSRIARRFTEPLQELVAGTQRIAGGATSLGLQPAELELATLADAIDHMAVKIDEGRQQLLLEKNLVDRMMNNITSGVISLDEAGCVVMANQAARELFEVEVGECFEEALADRERLAGVRDFVLDRPTETTLRTVRLSTQEEELEWSLVWVPLPGPGEPTALLVVEDVTEVLRAQRLEAWAEMARIIAHEIKNPLTPIRLSAEHMRQVRESDPEHFDTVFERCTTNILEQVRELQEISTEFSAYSRLPSIEREKGDLVELVERIVEGYRSAPTTGIEMALDKAVDELPVELDAKLVGRALRNLIENALRAAGDRGAVTVRVERAGDEAHVLVLDDGPGIEPELLARVFEPYFSTHDTGTGLGLPITRRIAEEHGGRVEARNRAAGGLEVRFTLPLG